MTIPIFKGHIDKGRIKHETPEKFAVYLAKLEGKRVEIIVRKQKSQRSIDQNRAYWGIVIEILSDHLGYDKDEVHSAMKVKFASRIDEKTGLIVVESTAKMNTVRFNKYYEDIQRWASEFLNVYIPDPNECDYAS